MTRLTVVTPTYRPDLDLFRRLHESVLRFTAENVVHHAIVPAADLREFSAIRSSRLVVTTTEELLPAHYLSTYALTRAMRGVPALRRWPPIQSVNPRRPWPPIRGWILQQAVKLAAAESSDADVVLAVDSDVCFVRPVTPELFHRDGVTRLYRSADAIRPDMPDHIAWHGTARRLLGLPASGSTSSHDYIAPMIALDPRLVRDLRDRLESTTGRGWLDTMTGELRFSEYILYGTYVEEIAPARARSFVSEESLCRSRWGSEALAADEVPRLLASLTPDDVAVHVQSTSGADAGLRDAIAEAARQRFG